VVGRPHDIKGEAVFAYVVLNVSRPQGADAQALIDELRGWVAEQLSPIAKPDDVRLTDNLPKTRSGKIMRRLLRSIARGEEITQDVTTLENPAILEQLRGDSVARAAEPVAVKKTARTKKSARVKRAVAKKTAPKTKTTVKVKRKTSSKAPKRKVGPKEKAAAKRKMAARRKK
jgi:CCR4-NOT transcriptional regulation complex NOT5 subunit